MKSSFLRSFYRLVLIGCSILSSSVLLLALDAGKLPSQYSRNIWQIENGLPSNTVSTIFQARNGYVWLGTFEGLSRFDGVRFTNFDGNDFPELNGNRVLAVTEDKNNNLYFGTQTSGLYKFEEKKIVRIGHQRIFGSINKLFTDASGIIWVGSSNGIFRLENGVPVEVMKTKQLPQGFKYSFCDGNRAVWIGTPAGLYTYTSGALARENGFPEATITGLCSDKFSNIWVAASDNVVKLIQGDAQQTLMIKRFSDSPVQSLLADKDGNIWIGTEDAGLNKIPMDRRKKCPAFRCRDARPNPRLKLY